MRSILWGGLFVLLLNAAALTYSQDKPQLKAESILADTPAVTLAPAELHERFQKLLSNARLIGQFTVVGRETGRLTKEEYLIQKVEKLPGGEKWMFHCRIKYGDHDVAIPLPIDVKWAGSTPIITLDELTIPGMGTFSSRVVLHDDKYAGTWRHDKVSGHLFGVIEKAEKSSEPAAPGKVNN